MALSAGSTSVDSAGHVTGTGLSRELFDAQIANLLTMYPDFATESRQAILVQIKQSIAGSANILAQTVVAHILANAEITLTIGTGDSGLQRTPNPNDPGVDTQGPTAAKTLTVTLK